MIDEDILRHIGIKVGYKLSKLLYEEMENEGLSFEMANKAYLIACVTIVEQFLARLEHFNRYVVLHHFQEDILRGISAMKASEDYDCNTH
jgi:hypothetical protein